MDYEQKQALALVGDMGKHACAKRLRAARKLTGLTQKQFAEESRQKSTAINNAERGLSYPSRDSMRFLYRNYLVDFTFILHGDFAQLPANVSAALFEKLAAE